MAKRSTGLTRTEEELLDAARGGDGDAFRRLVDRHRADLYAHCYRMLGSLHDADDALQETLLRAWRALSRFGGLGLLQPWLYKIATNVCLEQLGTTVASVNSALQRARKSAAERLPEQSQQATLRSLGDASVRGIVERYMAVWEWGAYLVTEMTAFMTPQGFPRFGLPETLSPDVG